MDSTAHRMPFGFKSLIFFLTSRYSGCGCHLQSPAPHTQAKTPPSLRRSLTSHPTTQVKPAVACNYCKLVEAVTVLGVVGLDQLLTSGSASRRADGAAVLRSPKKLRSVCD